MNIKSTTSLASKFKLQHQRQIDRDNIDVGLALRYSLPRAETGLHCLVANKTDESTERSDPSRRTITSNVPALSSTSYWSLSSVNFGSKINKSNA